MDDWVKEEYERILTAAILKNGSLVRNEGNTYYGWTDYEATTHISSCGAAKTGRIVEDAYWYEFMGTFYEGDETVHGMEVHGVTCNCGRITDRVYRWSESPGEAIRIVLESVLEDKVKSSE